MLSLLTRRSLLNSTPCLIIVHLVNSRLLHSSCTLLQREAKTKAKSKEKPAKSGPPSGGAAPEVEGGVGGDGDVEDTNLGAKDLPSMLGRAVEYARREFTKVRGSAVNAAMLDHILVDAYGEMQPLKDVAQVALKGATTLVVNPFDGALAEAVANAVRDADLGLNPTVDGNLVRVMLPKASKETREAAVKLVSKIAEHAKTRARRARAAELEKIKKTALPEDDARRDSKAVDEAVTAATAEIAKLAEAKKLEVERG